MEKYTAWKNKVNKTYFKTQNSDQNNTVGMVEGKGYNEDHTCLTLIR